MVCWMNVAKNGEWEYEIRMIARIGLDGDRFFEYGLQAAANSGPRPTNMNNANDWEQTNSTT